METTVLLGQVSFRATAVQALRRAEEGYRPAMAGEGTNSNTGELARQSLPFCRKM
jgi:hypothetical protein